eukprot:g26250.t1
MLFYDFLESSFWKTPLGQPLSPGSVLMQLLRFLCKAAYFCFESFFFATAVAYYFQFNDKETLLLLFICHLPISLFISLIKNWHFAVDDPKANIYSTTIFCYLTLLQIIFFSLTISDSPLLHPKMRLMARYIQQSATVDVLVIMALLSLIPLCFKRFFLAWPYSDRHDKQLHMVTLCCILIGSARLETNQRSFGCHMQRGTDTAVPISVQAKEDLRELLQDLRAFHAGTFTPLSAEALPDIGPTRLAYSHTHACVKATFRPADLVPPHLRHGLFGMSEHSFPAYLRFSAHSPEAVRQHGLSMKVLNIPGEGPAASAIDPNRHSHDFLFSRANQWPWARGDSAEDLVTFLRILWEGLYWRNFWPFIQYLLPSWNPFTWRLKYLLRMYHLAQSMGRDTHVLLNTNFWSVAPYRLGKTAVRYSLRPCPHADNKQHYEESNMSALLMPHQIEMNFRKQLDVEEGGQGACFNLFVQEQLNPCLDALDDLYSAWHSDWVLVGTVTVPPQHFTESQHQFCLNNLSFSPFNTGQGHEPIGVWSKLAEVGYSIRFNISGFSVQQEPRGDEVFDGPPFPPRNGGQGDRTIRAYPYPAPFHELPRKVVPFRQDMDFSAQDWGRISTDMLRTHAQIELQFYHRNFSQANLLSPEDYRFFFTVGGNWLATDHVVREVADRWWLDEEFARQYLAGVNPVLLRRLTENDLRYIQEQSPFGPALSEEDALARMLAVVSAADGRDANIKGKTASALTKDNFFLTLLAQQRLFWVDYQQLENVYMIRNRLFYAPVVLFFTTQHSKTLLPLCIVLTRHPAASFASPDCPDSGSAHSHEHLPQRVPNIVYTPPPEFHTYTAPRQWEQTQEARVWVFAKMHVTLADAMVHQSVSHLALTHLTLEPIIVAFRRSFSSDHPLHILLSPHFENTLAINELGRNSLLGDTNSDFDRVLATGKLGSLQLMQTAYANRSILDSAVPRDLRRRGLWPVDPANDPLPGYVHRDLAILWWDTFEKYVSMALHVAYTTEQDIRHDQALQAFVTELSSRYFSALPGPPVVADSFSSLTELLATLIFVASCGHSAVNFGQLDYYTFVPGRPLFLTKGMPVNHSRVTMSFIMSALPDYDATLETIAMAHTLSLEELDPIASRLSKQTKVQELYPAPYRFLLERMEKLAHDSEAASARSPVPYRYLHPQRIAPSIAI